MKPTNFPVICKLFFAAAILNFAAIGISAQIDEVVIVREKAKATIRPKAKPASKKVDTSRKVTIERVAKKNRVSAKPNGRNSTASTVKRKTTAPLLALQLRLMLVGKDNSEAEVNPQGVYTPDDRLRLSVKANQRGYLYVVRQRNPEEEGELIFPSPLINGGNNNVSANYEYVLPSGCPKKQYPDERDCALILYPFDVSPQEFYTLIFTRDRLIDLPNQTNKRAKLTNLFSAGKIEPKTLIDLIEDSKQDLVTQKGDTQFSMRIVNVNPQDNEEIIETFVLQKVGK